MRTGKAWAESCKENGAVELEDQLADRLHAVAERAKRRLRVPSVLERTRNGIKAAQVVGVVSASGATLEILPKIDGQDGAVRKALVRMLAVAWDLRVADGELASLDTQRSNLLEVLIGLFANRLLVAVRRGLPRRYVGHGFSLLFPMYELFERFVGRCLLRAVARSSVCLQDTGHSALRDAEGRLFDLQPDVVIKTQTGPIVLDTKWKALDNADGRQLGVAQDDVYQILMYGQAYSAERLVLLYPWHSGLNEGINRRWQVVRANRRLDIATVDVGNPSRVVSALRKIVGADDDS